LLVARAERRRESMHYQKNPNNLLRLLQNPSRRPPAALDTMGSASDNDARTDVSAHPDVSGAEKGSFQAHFICPAFVTGFSNLPQIAKKLPEHLLGGAPAPAFTSP